METVEVIRAGVTVDPFSGEEIAEDWNNPTVTVVPNCIIEPRTTSEPVPNGRTAVITGYTVHMPYGSDVTAKDRVRLYGETWNVDGYPFKWKNAFTGHEFGLEVQLKKVDG